MSQAEENEATAFYINLKKDFLKWIHSHKLIDNIDRDSRYFQTMMSNFVEETPFAFGGAYRKQFKNVEDIKSFITAFNSLLNKFKISFSHRASLLYAIVFLGENYEKQSLDINENNRLIEYTRFILDLFQTGKSHFDSIAKNPDYQMIFDEGTREYFFAKKELFKKFTLEQIVEDRPNEKPDDLVQYLRVSVYESEMYIPYDLMFTITSSKTLKAFLGNVIPNIEVPAFLQSELFKYTINYMLKAHESNNTEFYKMLSEPDLSTEDLKKIYNKFKKHRVSLPEALLRIAIIVSDYITENKLLRNKKQIGDFLFDYFALFKVIPLKKQVNFPTDYSELPLFYIKNGISRDRFRLMFKNVDTVEEI